MTKTQKIICFALTGLLVSLAFAANESDVPPLSAQKLKIDQANRAILDQISRYQDLKELEIMCLETLEKIPEEIGSLSRLEVLSMDNGSGCAMNAQLPSTIGQLQNLRKLNLDGAQENFGTGPRRSWPEGLARLKNLEELSLGRNGFKNDEIPSLIKNLSRLKRLDLSFNKLTSIPAWLGSMKNLERLSLIGNDLKDIPTTQILPPNLKDLFLGNNCVITTSQTLREKLKNQFPRVHLDFEDEYDCPAKAVR